MNLKQILFTFALLFSLATSDILTAQSASGGENRVGSWAASQQIPEPRNALPAEDLHDATLRQIVHLSIGGKTLRVHMSNAFGVEPLHLSSVHIARPVSPSSSRIDPASDRALSFSGSPDVTIPAGAEYISDAIDYPSASLSDIAISLHIDTPPTQQTSHPGSRSTTYIAHGDLVSAVDLPGAKTVEHWYMIGGIDVVAPAGAFSVVTLGDSITDGHAATTNGNDRWPDVLAQRLQASPATQNIGVLNHGIGGNHLLIDGLGPNALARFDRDVLAQPGARYVILLEGVNDLGGLSRMGDVPAARHDALVQAILGSYEQIVMRAHAHGVRVIGATITPYAGSGYYHPAAAAEADRQKVNQWIRAAGHFDAVVDFDKVTADPKDPTRMLPTYDSGDHLHPSPAGYRAMGQAIPLSLFTK
jgi:lysophospholipase L1-like esterase